MIPVLTYWGVSLAALITGSVLIEVVYGLSGMGRLTVRRDQPAGLADCAAGGAVLRRDLAHYQPDHRSAVRRAGPAHQATPSARGRNASFGCRNIFARLCAAARPFATGTGRDRVPRFCRAKPLGAIGAVIIALMLFAAVAAPQIVQYDFQQTRPREKLQSPSADHWFGTDQFGRDIFARIVYGARVSLSVGFIGTFLGVFVGSAIGLFGGYLGGKLDMVLMRIVDAVQAFPGLILALAIVAALGPGLPRHSWPYRSLCSRGRHGWCVPRYCRPSRHRGWRRRGPWAHRT